MSRWTAALIRRVSTGAQRPKTMRAVPREMISRRDATCASTLLPVMGGQTVLVPHDAKTRRGPRRMHWGSCAQTPETIPDHAGWRSRLDGLWCLRRRRAEGACDGPSWRTRPS